MFLTVDNSLNTRKSATGAAEVTPDDTGELARGNGSFPTLYLFRGGASLRVLTASGDDVIFRNCQNSSHLPVQIRRVFNSDTVAVAGIVAFY